MKEGREWAVAVDLHAFFDKDSHGLILQVIRRKVADKPLATLIDRLLKAGIIVKGAFGKTTKVCPQGSLLSPMISNIVLNELDHTLEERHLGLGYGRWADEVVILVRSERAAWRVMEGTRRYLEEELGLTVNQENSRIAPIKDLTFRGFSS